MAVAPQKGKTLNLEKVVQDYFDQWYDTLATRKMRRIKAKKQMAINVDWSRVKFKDETKWPRLAEALFDEEDESTMNDPNSNKPQENVATTELAEGAGAVKASILFQTKFTNDTEYDQEYTMHTSKTTCSICETAIEHSYTKGIDMSVTLKTPCEIFEMNAGYHREMTLTNSQGQAIEEEVTWSVDSQIKVKSKHTATAKLIVNEKKYSGEFYVVSRLSGPVYVTYNNLKDNNSLIRSGEDDLVNIVKEFLETQADIGDPYDSFVQIEGREVVITTKGTCQFRCGIKQEVVVKQLPM